MKKTITVKSRGEAQRLLISGEVKELRSVYGGPYFYNVEFGLQWRDEHGAWRESLLGVGPWTYEVDVPETRAELIARLAPGYEECAKHESEGYNGRGGLALWNHCGEWKLGRWGGMVNGEHIWLHKSIDRSSWPAFDALKVGDRFRDSNGRLCQITSVGDRVMWQCTDDGRAVGGSFVKNGRWPRCAVEFNAAPKLPDGFEYSITPSAVDVRGNALALGPNGVPCSVRLPLLANWRWIVPKMRAVSDGEISDAIGNTLDGETQILNPYAAFRAGVRWRESVK